jgi:hypothetical protein
MKVGAHEGTLPSQAVTHATSIDTLASSAATTANTQAATQTRVSQRGDLLQRLQQLEQTDPNKFKTLLTTVSDQLRSAASQQTGAAQTSINALADRFVAAANSGQVSKLRPPGASSTATPPAGGAPEAGGTEQLQALEGRTSRAYHQGGPPAAVHTAEHQAFQTIAQALGA